jgi:hypothetical protein
LFPEFKVNPAIFLIVFKIFAHEIFDFEVAVDELAVVSKEYGLRFIERFSSIFEDVLLNFAQLNEEVLLPVK